MVVDLLNRRISFLAAFFAFIGVVLGVVALATNYWTANSQVIPSTREDLVNGTVLNSGGIDWTWNGLFYTCSNVGVGGCYSKFVPVTFVLCVLGLVFLLVGGIFLCWNVTRINDRRFLVPLFFFVACVLLTAGLFDYAAEGRLNSHSSRAMIAAVVFAYSALGIAAFVAGRFSAFDRFVGNGHATNGQKYVQTSTNGN